LASRLEPELVLELALELELVPALVQELALAPEPGLGLEPVPHSHQKSTHLPIQPPMELKMTFS